MEVEPVDSPSDMQLETHQSPPTEPSPEILAEASTSPTSSHTAPVGGGSTEEKVERPNSIELPSIGAVTGIKGNGMSMGGPKHPSLQRPNIVQLPVSMLSSKGPVMSNPPHSQSLHGVQSAPTARIMSPTYPSAAPPGYVMMQGGQPYHPSAPPPPPPQQQQQKMELHDAFAYLDRVKAEFADQPDVYNRFLQIMREFKANAYISPCCPPNLNLVSMRMA